uniref:Endoplasmic reticulum lectin n=1 Tax=Sinocyclocheilus rhinocerous TaxID=307959 RepID=A0A673I4Z5_9TELE
MASSLIKWLRGLYVFFLTCLLSVLAFLNLEELNEMKYGIQILPDPVIMGQMEDVMLVSNKYKQLYECRLPAQAVRFHQDPVSEPDVQGYSGPGVPDLLKPMQTAPCLVKTKDWWTYEFCYGQHIRQYHLEDSEIKGDVLFLGYYDSEFDWTNETAKASKQHKMKRYHSQSYVNGSKCDLNGNPRETEVRFVCEEGSSDYIARVDEPQSCRYVLTVHTSRTCQHPLLRPPSTAKPQGIVCQPALSAQQYMDYVNAQVSTFPVSLYSADTKRKVEQISEELKNLDEILSKDDKNKGLQDDKTDEDPVVHSDEPPLSESETKEDEVAEGGLVREEPEDKDFWEGVTKPASTESSTDSENPQDSQNDIFGEEKFNFKIITDPADLMKFVQHLRESNQKNRKAELEKEIQQSSQKKEEQEEEEKKREESAAGREVEEGDEDETLLQEFEDEMADLSVPSSKIEEIKEEMQKEYDNIIEEAQQELENEGLKGEFDRSQATQTLENTLGKLLDRLEDKTGHESQLETEKNTEMHKSTHTQHKTEGGPSAGSPNLVPKTPAQAGSSGEQVKVRVTKYKVGGGVAAGAVTGGNDDDDGGEGGVKVKELGEGDPQWQQIQEVVKEQLERAGIKAEGKIEVKILTRKTAEEAGDQWLTEEDTKSFRELLINLLTGGTEEVYKEQKRQQELENNYKFVWGDKQEESQSTGNSDSDETDF